MKTSINIGIIGGGGYAAGELLRLLLFHPNINIKFVESRSQAGKNIDEVHTDLIGECEIKFTDNWDTGIDLMFLCRGHQQSRQFLSENNVPDSIKIIDLSQDFRLNKNSSFQNKVFLYGLPEINREIIKTSSYIANPGCFATSIELALLPLAPIIYEDIHVHAITGSTGAGQTLTPTSQFSWRNDNVSVYKVFIHQHLNEINETVQKINKRFNAPIRLIPVRGNYSRGIFTTLYTKTHFTEEQLIDLFKSYYNQHPFVRVTNNEINLKQVINTNNCLLSVKKYNDMVFVTSIIDNLMKGASGQAVQNMNLMIGVPESTGLKTKPLGP